MPSGSEGDQCGFDRSPVSALGPAAGAEQFQELEQRGGSTRPEMADATTNGSSIAGWLPDYMLAPSLDAKPHNLADADDPGAALLQFLTVAADQRQRHDLTFLQAASEDDPRVADIMDQLHARLGTLVDRARAAGVIRSDITEADIFLMMCAPISAAMCAA